MYYKMTECFRCLLTSLLVPASTISNKAAGLQPECCGRKLAAVSWLQRVGCVELAATSQLQRVSCGKLAAASWLRRVSCGQLAAASWLRQVGCGELLRRVGCGELAATSGSAAYTILMKLMPTQQKFQHDLLEFPAVVVRFLLYWHGSVVLCDTVSSC